MLAKLSFSICLITIRAESLDFRYLSYIRCLLPLAIDDTYYPRLPTMAGAELEFDIIVAGGESCALAQRTYLPFLQVERQAA